MVQLLIFFFKVQTLLQCFPLKSSALVLSSGDRRGGGTEKSEQEKPQRTKIKRPE